MTPVVNVCVRFSVPVVWGEQLTEHFFWTSVRDVVLSVMGPDIKRKLVQLLLCDMAVCVWMVLRDTRALGVTKWAVHDLGSFLQAVQSFTFHAEGVTATPNVVSDVTTFPFLVRVPVANPCVWM